MVRRYINLMVGELRMEFKEKLGLIFFMIGLSGAFANGDSPIFWLAIIVVFIGLWLFLGKIQQDANKAY